MNNVVLELINVSVFYLGKRLLFKKNELNQALYTINLHLQQGEILAVVGESGSGKSTLGKSIVGLVHDISGQYIYNNNHYDPSNMDNLRGEIQIIFQDALSSLNPRLRISSAIREVINHHHPKVDQEKKLHELLEKVDLPFDTRDKYPHELSGGQRQRACIARALAVEPKVLICDEIVSALDVSVQAKILNLLLKLVFEDGLSILFTTHDLHVVESFAQSVIVMKSGRIVEIGSVKDVFHNPEHEYTKKLLESIPEKV